MKPPRGKVHRSPHKDEGQGADRCRIARPLTSQFMCPREDRQVTHAKPVLAQDITAFLALKDIWHSPSFEVIHFAGYSLSFAADEPWFRSRSLSFLCWSGLRTL
jgi:hypothetical protein